MTFPRYPKYKDSGVEWLGEVPEDWDVSPLKRNLSINNGKDHKHVEQEAGYPVYGSGGVFAWAGEYLYEGEAVLLGRKGTIDKPLYVNERFWTVDTMFYAIANKVANSKYFYYVSTQIPFDLYSTNTALPSMTQSTLGSHIVAAPKIHEQTKIAAFLDKETSKIDALIAEQDKLVELLKEKRQGIISHVVTKGLNPKAKMKDSGVEWLGEVPDGWEVKRLKYLCKVQTGDKDTVNSIEDGAYPFFVRSQTIENINSYTYDCEAVLTAGDGAGVGKVFHYYVGKFDFHQRVYMMNDFIDIKGQLFFYYLQSLFHKVALEGGAKSTVDSLRMPLFLNFPITVPTLYEQENIIQFIKNESAKFDNLIDEANKASELLKERRAALISAAVTGKIDVRNSK